MSKENQDKIRKDTFLNNLFYSDELANYTDDKEVIEQRKKELEDTIRGFNPNELVANKETLLQHNEFMTLLASTITSDYLDIERLNEIIQDYDRVNNFFNNEGDNAYNILKEYKGIVTKDRDGFYKINDTILDKVINDNGFYLSYTDDKEQLKNTLFDTWENQQELITQDKLDKYSEERNGINFKHFVFCEEYLKRGKIKPTCEHLGISRNSAYLWLKDEKVQAYLNSRKEEIKQETDNTFLDTYTSCFNELNNIINSETTERSDKIRAIDVFLKHYENLERLKQPSTMYED